MKKFFCFLIIAAVIVAFTDSCCCADSSTTSDSSQKKEKQYEYVISGGKVAVLDSSHIGGQTVRIFELTVTDSLGHAETHQYIKIGNDGGFCHYPGCKYCKHHANDDMSDLIDTTGVGDIFDDF